jgi:hypothetical protein
VPRVVELIFGAGMLRQTQKMPATHDRTCEAFFHGKRPALQEGARASPGDALGAKDAEAAAEFSMNLAVGSLSLELWFRMPGMIKRLQKLLFPLGQVCRRV